MDLFVILIRCMEQPPCCFAVFTSAVSVVAVIFRGIFQQIFIKAETDWERDLDLEIEV